MQDKIVVVFGEGPLFNYCVKELLKNLRIFIVFLTSKVNPNF